MKILARLPLIKLNLAALVRLISMEKAEDICESNFFRADSTLDNITQELKINGFSVNISCKEKTLADLNEAAQLNKLYQQYITETDPKKIASLEGRIRSLAPAAGRG